MDENRMHSAERLSKITTSMAAVVDLVVHTKMWRRALCRDFYIISVKLWVAPPERKAELRALLLELYKVAITYDLISLDFDEEYAFDDGFEPTTLIDVQIAHRDAATLLRAVRIADRAMLRCLKAQLAGKITAGARERLQGDVVAAYEALKRRALFPDVVSKKRDAQPA